MANCIIHPIPLYQAKGDKARATYLQNFGQQLNTVNYVWYIEGARERILVDAGGDVGYVTTVVEVTKEFQTLDSGLNKLGISFDDINLVILTHLHADHVAQAHRFPKARLLVQKDELEFAQNPHPAFIWIYCKEFYSGLNFEVVSGDVEICEEVSVISTPGHTPGGQSVVIKTARGTAIISGLCTIRENFEPPPPIKETMPVIAPGIHTNLFEAYNSLLRIKKMADIVIPLHEAELAQKSTIP